MWDQGWFPESGLTGNRETMQQLFVQKELVQVMLQPKLPFLPDGKCA